MCISLLFCFSVQMLLSTLNAIEVNLKSYNDYEDIAIQRATTVLPKPPNIFEDKRDQLDLFSDPETQQRRLLLEVEKAAREIELEPTTFDHNKNNENEPLHEKEDNSVAATLAKRVKVLCMVLTHPENHRTKAVHVKATWGKRCNRLLFMSTEEEKFKIPSGILSRIGRFHFVSRLDVLLPTVKLRVKEGRKYLWLKVRAAFSYVYYHHRNEADWFLKADDDTYVVMENLRYFLSGYKSTDPYHFGHRMREGTKKFMHGGAGYVLSRSALDLLVKKGLPSSKFCPTVDEEIEDIQISSCLNKIGVTAIDPRDFYENGRFFPDPPHIYIKHHYKYRCCSDHTISFHHVSPDEMYTYEYFLYHFRPYGVSYRGGVYNIPKKINDSSY